MAHLRPGDPDPTPGADGRDRAQLLLLAGFALAAVFVAFAFLLNSVIYTENLATRGEGARTSHAIAVADDAARGTEGVVGYANEHNTSTYEGTDSTPYASLEDELLSGIADLELLMETQELASGGVLTVDHVSHRKGTWVNQSYNERNFTDDDFNPDWRLVDDAEGVRSFRIHVTDPGELEDVGSLAVGETPRNFTVEASDGTDTWKMEVYHDDTGLVDTVTGTPYVLEITDGNGNKRYCTVPDGVSEFWINVTDGTVGGEPCSGLVYGENVSATDQVDFENGGHVHGTYRLMAAKDVSSVDLSVYNGTSAPPPVVEPAIYNATIEVSYETENLYFETERDVELREVDDG